MLRKDLPKIDSSQTKLPKESVSLKAVFIFLGLIFILLITMLVYLRFCSWSPFYDFYAKKIPQSLSFADRFNKTKSNTSMKTVDLKITESDLSSAVSIEKNDFPLKQATLKIKPEGIIVNGKTSTAFWGIPVEVILVPIAGNGKLLVQVKEIKAGGVIAPPKIANSLSPKINTLFNQSFSSLDSLNIKEARTFVGYIMLEVEK